MVNQAENLNTSSCEIVSSNNSIAIVNYKWEKLLTLLDENWDFFRLNWNPILLSNIQQRDLVKVWFVTNNDIFKAYINLPKDCKNFILFEWTVPQKIISSKWKEFLLFFNDYLEEQKIFLWNDSNIYKLSYPLENIEWDLYLKEKNNDFAIWINLSDWRESLYIIKEWKYILADLSKAWFNNTFWYIELPNKDSMFVINWKLCSFDDKESTIQLVDIWVNYMNANLNNWNYEITLVGWDFAKINFNAWIENPKTPETLVINGTCLFLKYREKSWWNNNWEYIFTTTINSIYNEISLDKFVEIEWIRFHLFWGKENPNFPSKYTDWKGVYEFETDKDWNVKFIEFEWKQLPYKTLTNYTWINNNDFYSIEVLNINWNVKEYLPVISQWNSGEYERLVLNEEQNKLNIIWIFNNHWIVCLAEDSSNTSRFQFYRVTSDNTLTYVFHNNYSIILWKNRVSIKVSSEDENKTDFYELIRNPDSNSILEPHLINGIECYIVKTSNWNKYVMVNDNCNWFVFTNKNIEIDPKTNLPIQKNSFSFNNIDIYLDKKWVIELLWKKFHLTNIKWENVTKPKKAIINVWWKKVLLLKELGENGYNNIFCYVEWIKNDLGNQEVYFYKKISDNSWILLWEWDNVRFITVWEEKYILRYEYENFNTLWIIEILDKWLSLRNINRKLGTNWEYIWEEFECEWQTIKIKDVLSEKILQWFDWKYYYRTNSSKNIKFLELPINVIIWNNIHCNPKNYKNIVWLKLLDWELSKIEIDWKLLYITEFIWDEYLINWEKAFISTFFNPSTNKLESYKKVWDKYERISVWWSSDVVFCDDVNVYIPSISPNKRQYITITKKWLIDAEILNDTWTCTLLEQWKTYNNFQMWLNAITWEFSMYAVKWIWNKFYAISCIKEWYNMKNLEWWKMSVNWIEYSKQMLDFLYEELTKGVEKIHMDKIIKAVWNSVWSVIKE